MALKVKYQEVGQTGLRQYGGFIFDEDLPALSGKEALRKYAEMELDPVIGAFLFAIKMLIRNVQWNVNPAEGHEDEAANDEAVKFLKEVLFEDMEHTFADFLSEVISMVVYGFAIHEIVWKVRGGKETKDLTRKSRFNDNKIGIRKLAPRAQRTLWRWIFDEETGDLLGVEQQFEVPRNGTSVAVIPREKFLSFRTESNKDNPEGRSMLRSSYKPYMRKNEIELAEGRSAIRGAGVVELRLPSEYMDPTADSLKQAVYAQIKSYATKLANDRQGSMILPSDKDDKGNELFVFRYVTTADRKPADMTPIIERYDKRIAMTVMADFILLGQQSAGSFALSDNKTALFSQALGAILTHIKEVLNRDLIPKVWDVNGLPEETMPTVAHEDVETPDLEKLGAYIQRLASTGVALFPNPKLENALLAAAKLPPMSDEERDLIEEEKTAEQDRQIQLIQAKTPPEDGNGKPPVGGGAPPKNAK